MDDVENEDGIRCTGAPVFDHAGHVVAGLSVSVPATRFDTGAPARLGAQVRAAAADLSRRLGWGGTPADGPLRAGSAVRR
jgi:IclR family acetate operon transcriptional repressor